MPEEKKTVDIDTSGPEVDVTIEEKKDEAVIETEASKEETSEWRNDFKHFINAFNPFGTAKKPSLDPPAPHHLLRPPLINVFSG